MPVGRINVFQRRGEQGPARAAVGAGARLPVGLQDVRVAAVFGHLEVLKWARDHDCPWNETTCTKAVEGGHLEVLKWARKHGCPWTAAMRDLAATKGYSDNLPLSV